MPAEGFTTLNVDDETMLEIENIRRLERCRTKTEVMRMLVRDYRRARMVDGVYTDQNNVKSVFVAPNEMPMASKNRKNAVCRYWQKSSSRLALLHRIGDKSRSQSKTDIPQILQQLRANAQKRILDPTEYYEEARQESTNPSGSAQSLHIA